MTPWLLLLGVTAGFLLGLTWKSLTSARRANSEALCTDLPGPRLATPEDARSFLESTVWSAEPEIRVRLAVGILCSMLLRLGYKEVVDAFDRVVPEWAPRKAGED